MAIDAVDVILRGGETLRLRPPTRDDAEELLAFFNALSQRSLYLRFHGFPRLGPELVEQLVDPNWTERGALVGTFVDEGRERVVAVANYVRLRDPALAEAAFAVADDYQRRGIGTRLVEQLADARRPTRHRANRGRGARRRTAGCSRVFESLGFELSRELSRRRNRDRLSPSPPLSSTRHASTSATTSPSPRPCDRSSSRAPSPSSAPRGGGGRSAASSSATSSPPTSSGAAYPVNRDGIGGGGRPGVLDRSPICPRPPTLP